MDSHRVYDAIVIGSGATGGWAAKTLTEGGMDVLVLEAGPELSPESGQSEPVAPEIGDSGESPSGYTSRGFPLLRNARTGDPHELLLDRAKDPYLTPGEDFHWVRGRQTGGRSLLWNGVCLRISQEDFKAASADGHGEDWPFDYADIAPYYDRVEEMLGVYGCRDGHPRIPDGRYLGPTLLSDGEAHIKRTVESRWSDRLVMPRRTARRWQGPVEAEQLLGGFYDTRRQAWRRDSSPGSTLIDAARTRRLTLRTDAIVRRVITDPDTGRATGVAFVDQVTGTEIEARGRVVLACASTIESTRILLNSATHRHPNGLGNGSDVLGRYLTDHITTGMDGLAPGFAGVEDVDPPDTMSGFLMPQFRNVRERHPGFIRGYNLFGRVTPLISPTDFDRDSGTWEEVSSRVRELGVPARWFIFGVGEMLPRPENRVTLSSDRSDRWGVPLAKIECRIGDNERAMFHDMREAIAEIANECGMSVMGNHGGEVKLGAFVHEVGTARMGREPKTSYLNAFNQSWEVDNLYVCDGACFTSAGTQNPTLTMMALTARACDNALARARRGEL